MPRLFLAVWPPDHVTAELTALPRKDQRGVRFVRPENWHITLRFLGEAAIDDVVGALAGVPLVATQAQLGPAVDVLAERVLIVPVTGLDELGRTVTRHTRQLGKPPPKRFIAHLTLARLKRRARMPHAVGVPFSATFAVEEVALVQSRLDPDGARYETVHAWPVPPGEQLGCDPSPSVT